MYKSLSSFCAKFDNSALAFTFAITLRELSGNFYISNCIKVFLSSTVATAMLSITRIRTISGIHFAHDMAWPLSQASACSSQVLGLSGSASSFLTMRSHWEAAKLPSNFVINIIFVLRGVSKFNQSFANILADWLIDDLGLIWGV